MAGGRKPKPTRLKEILGTINVTRANRDEPMPKRGIPPCPTWLDGTAKTKWKEMVPELDRLGLLTIVDGDVLASYCQSWAEFMQATKRLQKDGRYVETEAGSLRSHPAVAQQRTAWAAILAFATRFGLDPSSRVKIRAPKVEASDPFEQFLEEKAGG